MSLPRAYYNEFHPPAAAWLRELIKAGHIAPGDVDERSIIDVRPDDLRSYTQCHFFAGIGGWSYALRLAGWPDDRPVWTGSTPCQGWSLAGKQQGAADDRDLWPVFDRLIGECEPDCIFGEQVPAAIRLGWLDRLAVDLETKAYAVGALVLPASGCGALHRRDRLCWVAARPDAGGVRSQGEWASAEGSWSWEQFAGLVQAEVRVSVPAGAIGGLSDGLPYRMAALSGFGNAIVPQVAAAFVAAFMAQEGEAVA